MLDHWNAFTARLSAGDPLVFAGLAALVALVTYALIRSLMRRRWLKIVLRTLYLLGVAGLVALAGLSLTYYKLEAWYPVYGPVVVDALASPIVWVVGAAVVAAGLALRKPVRPRHGINVSPSETEPDDASNVVQGPWADEREDREAA